MNTGSRSHFSVSIRENENEASCLSEDLEDSACFSLHEDSWRSGLQYSSPNLFSDAGLSSDDTDVDCNDNEDNDEAVDLDIDSQSRQFVLDLSRAESILEKDAYLKIIVEMLSLKIESNQPTVHFNKLLKLLRENNFTVKDSQGANRSLPRTFDMMFKEIGLTSKMKMGEWQKSYSCYQRCCMLKDDMKHCPICKEPRSNQDVVFWHRR